MNNRSAIRLLAVLVLTLSLAAIPSLTLGTYRVRGDNAPPRITDPSTQWVPAGAQMDKLQIQVYSDEVQEYNAMLQTPSSAVDLGDWPVPASDVASFVSDSRFYLTAPNSEFGMFEFDFNHANTYFGTNDAHGNNAAGIELRQAIAHLVNKPAVVLNLFGTLANAIDNPVPPGQGLLCSGLGCSSGTGPYTYVDTANGKTISLTGACGWETIASLLT